jgi:RNA polymerase sigma-70 factor, ECF subfamily
MSVVKFEFLFNDRPALPVSPTTAATPKKRGMAQPLDRQQFDRLLLQHLPAAQRLAVRLCGNPTDGEEIVQQALFRLARGGWKTFRGESAFSTWLIAVVINAFRDHRAARTFDELPEDCVDASMYGPVERLMGKELSDHVARCISTLPPRQREVVVLSALENFGIAEIAHVLNTSSENVRVNLHLARQRLKKLLRNYLSDES